MSIYSACGSPHYYKTQSIIIMNKYLKRVLLSLALLAVIMPVLASATDYYTVRTVDENGRDIENIVSTLNDSIATKMTIPTGSSGQVLLGDGTLGTLPLSPSSYQTIVSQTGTSTPAVSGGFSPMNSYSGTPTFTWARTGAGTYTITASSAIFNTSGKTGVFISPLNNLNASVRGVVTSSTVITVTTATQSVAVLGLLGLTATPTDALLANTMIYIQTYP